MEIVTVLTGTVLSWRWSQSELSYQAGTGCRNCFRILSQTHYNSHPDMSACLNFLAVQNKKKGHYMRFIAHHHLKQYSAGTKQITSWTVLTRLPDPFKYLCWISIESVCCYNLLSSWSSIFVLLNPPPPASI